MRKVPKQLLKHFLLFMLLLFGTLFISCENEEELLEEAVPIYNEDLPISIVTTTFEEAGEKFKQISKQHELESHKRLVSFGGIEKSGSSGGIVIISEEIKEIKRGDYTSYTMLIEPKDIESNIFYNLTIEDVKGVTKLFITKYDPTDAWLENNNMRFEGQITTFRIDDLQTALDRVDTPIMGGGEGGGTTTYPTDCDGTVVATVIVEEIPCGCHHSWQQLLSGVCTGCTEAQPAYPSLSTTTVYECVPSNPPSNENPPTGGGPGGGSGNTPPDASPAGNDPSLTAPVGPKDGAGNSTPCAELKKLSNNIATKNALADLKTQTNQVAEKGYAVKENATTNTHRNPESANANDPLQPNVIRATDYIGGEYVGFFHTHPKASDGWFPMFSPGDMWYLFFVATKHNSQGQPKDYSEYFITLTVPQGTYALKIKDYIKFGYVVTNKWKGKDGLEEKMINNFKARGSQGDINLMIKDLLDVLKKFDAGIGLYEASDDLNNWEEIVHELNPISPNFGQPKNIPCN